MKKDPIKQKKEEVIIDIEKFILFHNQRITLLRELEKEKKHDKLIFQVCFLGFESLAKILYPNETSGKRFVYLLKNSIEEKKAQEMYDDWRNDLIHQGFINSRFTTLECWGENDIVFTSFPETNSIRSSVEYPSMCMISIYQYLIKYTDDFFKEINKKNITIS